MSYDIATSLPDTIRSTLAGLTPADACLISRSIRDAIETAEVKAYARAAIEKLPGLMTLKADWETEVGDDGSHYLRWSTVLVVFEGGRSVALTPEVDMECGEYLASFSKANKDWLGMVTKLEEVDEPDLASGEADARIAAQALGVSRDELAAACSAIWALIDVAESQAKAGEMEVAWLATCP